VITIKRLTLEDALVLLQAAERKAHEIGVAETICVCRPRGSQTSGAITPLMPEKPAGETPMIVCGSPSSSRRCPTTSRAPPKRRCQRPSLSTTTGAAPGRSSSAV